jgi:AhpD family alkylhydroperoxidase
LVKRSKAYNSFLELEKHAYITNKLDRRIKELIAIGISIVMNCESCIEWHIHQAIEFGSTFNELIEAIEVGIEMGGGPATVSTRFAIKVIEYYQNKMIKELKLENEFIECTHIIKESFKTVADEFKITVDNAPSHPSNISYGKLKESIDKGLQMYGLQYKNKLIGCVGIEKAKNEDIYYIEKLTVLPDYRHKGYGEVLLDFAFCSIRDLNGKKVSIGIINKHTVLKNWYIKYGFKEKQIKKYDHLPFEVCYMEKDIV